MKKNSLLIISIFIYFSFMICASARSMTIEELGQEARKIDEYAGNVYIVGEHAFTSNFPFNTSDLMLAARTIKIDSSSEKNHEYETQSDDSYKNDTIYKKMNIFGIDYDWATNQWKKGTNLLGDEQLGESVDIKYINYHYIAEESKAEVTFDKKILSQETYKNGLKNTFGFNGQTKLYGDTDDEELEYDEETGKLTGLMFHYEIQKGGFTGTDKTGYYLPFVIEVPDATNDTLVTIKEDKETKVLGKDFDIKPSAQAMLTASGGQNPGVLVVWSIPGEGPDAAKKITITIDLDGPSNNEYGETIYTIDYSDLKFQGESEAQGISLSEASEKDKNTLSKEWGYDSSKNKGPSGEDHPTLTAESSNSHVYKLKGKLVEQKLNDSVYGSAQADGYYFDFTILLENNTDKKALVKAKVGKTGQEKTFQKDEYDDNGNLTILQRIAKDSSCATGSKSSDECSITITIDLDGDGNEYYPTTYTIDYSEVTFEKSSLVEVSKVSLESFTEDQWKGFDEDEHYSTEFTTNGSTVKVTGLITIFDDTEWQNGENPFGHDAYDYYLVFKLKRSDTSGSTVNQTVKFLTDGEGDNDQDKITNNDFGSNDEIYVLKYINPFKDGTTKKFTIEVDLDGDGETYAPYTLTFDWSALKFQNDSTSGSDYEPVDPDQIDSQDKTELESTYGFKFELDEISIDNEAQDEGTRRNGLKGTVKEQKLNDAAGFGTGGGYYVPVKITIPDELDESYQSKWTIYLKDGEGNWVEKKRSENHYEDKYIIVLFKMKNRDSQDIHYKIDYDGSENYDFILSDEITIHTQFTYLSENEVIFEYFDEKTGETKTEKAITYEGETIPADVVPQFTEANYSFHNFDYWYKKDTDGQTKYDIESATTKQDEDITLKAHWTIDVDKFLGEVIVDLASEETDFSQDFSSHFDVTKTDTTITFNVKNTKSKLSVLSETSIPGTIAYLLQRGEIKDITLFSGGKKVVFTKDGANNEILQAVNLDVEGSNLKEKIQVGAKALFTDLLQSEEGGEEAYTLNKMATDNRTFTLTVGAIDNSVSLSDKDKTSYEFKFISETKEVEDENSLKNALQASETKNIFIGKSFNVTNTIDITKKVDINGSEGIGITSSNNGPIFNVKSAGVKIENLELKAGTDTTSLISVESNGNLTASNLTITSADTNKLESAIEVKSGGQVNISGMKYDKEHYNNPAVKAAKDNVNINLTDIENKKATATEKEKFTVISDGNDTISKDTEYNKSYRNYYNNPKNSMIYKSVLYNYQGSYRLSYTKYNYYNDKISVPNLDPFKSFTYDGEKYDLIAFSESSVNLLRSDDSTQDGDIKTENLKATKNDAHFWAVFKVTLPAGVKIVDSAENFKTAISDGETHSIYVNKPLEIDYTTEEGGTLKINKDLSIIGTSRIDLVIKANKVEIGSEANDVFFNRVNFQIQAQNDQTALIEVNGKKLSIWQSSLKNTGTSVDYGIKYNNQTSSVVDVRYVGTSGSGFSESNINKGYIYIDGKMDEGSTLISNTFPNIAGKTTSVIIINGFTEAAAVTPDEDGEPDIRFEGNTVRTPYAIVFTKNTSGQKGDIKLGNSQIKIGIEYGDNQKDFKGIGLFTSPSNVEFAYLKASGSGEYQEETQKPEDVEGPTIKSVVEGVPGVADNSANSLVQTSNGKYSGTIAQSADGNFYLPITLSSVKFEERTSKITVTDPNQNTESYLYTAYNENGLVKDTKNVARINSINGLAKSSGTITLNLEAIKTSKIRGGNKAYTIAIDYDGNGEDEATYPIDYNGVKTEEEIILAAAEKTQAANSYTIEKDNNIKGGVEKFTYKIDKNNETRLYEGEVNSEQVQQYAFKYGDNGLYFVVEKSKKIDEAIPGKEDLGTRPKLNDWTYFNRFNKIATGVNELTLLQDLNKENAIIDAIEEVKQDETANTYIVTVNKEVLEHWLNAAYIDGHLTEEEEQDTEKHTSDNASITLKVTLDSNKEYVTKVETTANFTIKKTSEPTQTYTDNRINVTIKDINTTTVDGPKKMLGKDQTEVSDDDIKTFIEKGQEWWHKYTGSTSA